MFVTIVGKETGIGSYEHWQGPVEFLNDKPFPMIPQQISTQGDWIKAIDQRRKMLATAEKREESAGRNAQSAGKRYKNETTANTIETG